MQVFLTFSRVEATCDSSLSQCQKFLDIKSEYSHNPIITCDHEMSAVIGTTESNPVYSSFTAR